MWRFTDEGNLENKLRTWTFHSESSKFDPEDGEEGYIEVIDINKVLTFESGKIGFEVKETPINTKQRWSLGENVELINYASCETFYFIIVRPRVTV